MTVLTVSKATIVSLVSRQPILTSVPLVTIAQLVKINLNNVLKAHTTEERKRHLQMIVNLAQKALHVTKQELATTKTITALQDTTVQRVHTRSNHVSQVPLDPLKERHRSDQSATPTVTDKLLASFVQPVSTAQTRLNQFPDCANLELIAHPVVVSQSFATQVTTVLQVQVSKLFALQDSSAKEEKKKYGSANSVPIVRPNQELNSHALVAHMDLETPITLMRNLHVMHVEEAFTLCRTVMRLLSRDVKIAHQVMSAPVEQAQKSPEVRDVTEVISVPQDITAQLDHSSPHPALSASILSIQAVKLKTSASYAR